jgi:hypothetical protein
VRTRRPDDEAARRVAAPALEDGAEVDGDQIAVGEHFAVRDAVHDGVVDRYAQHRGERGRRPARVVVEEGRARVVPIEHVGGNLVELGGGLAGLRVLDDRA